MDKQNQQNKNRLVTRYFIAEKSVRPLIDAFVKREKRISPQHTQLAKDKIDIFKMAVLEEMARLNANDKVEIIEKVFKRLNKYLDRVIVLADSREDLGAKKQIYDSIKQFNEFMFFTCAVMTGYLVSPLIATSLLTIPVLGGIGLFLYFINEGVALISAVNNRKSLTVYSHKEIKSFEQNLLGIVKYSEDVEWEDLEKELMLYERILASGEPDETLNLAQSLTLEYLYYASITNHDFTSLVKQTRDHEVKEVLRLIDSLVKSYSQIFVLSLSAVDSNRPIPKPISIFKRFLSIKGVVKFIGYVLLNSVTFTFFYESFEGNKLGIITLTVACSLAVLAIISFFEQQFIKGIERAINKAQKIQFEGVASKD